MRAPAANPMPEPDPAPAPGPGPPRTSAPALNLKTAFSKDLGLSEAAYARTARSKCWKCGAVILKDEIRFSYYHSLIRPPGWLHARCIASLAIETQSEQSALQRLHRIKDAWGPDVAIVQCCNAIIQELTGS